jgi:hypothetical protein
MGTLLLSDFGFLKLISVVDENFEKAVCTLPDSEQYTPPEMLN